MTILFVISIPRAWAASMHEDPGSGGKRHWEGNFSFVGGTDFKTDDNLEGAWTNEQVSGSANVSYTDDKLYLKLTANSDFIQNFKNNTILIFASVDSICGDELRYIIDRRNNNGIGVGLGYFPNKRDELRFDFNFGSKYNNSSIMSGSLKFDEGWYVKFEDFHYRNCSYVGKFSYLRHVDSEREITASAGMGVVTEDNCSDWNVGEFLPTYEHWREDSSYVMPYRYLYDYNGIVKYSDKTLFNVDNLGMDLSLGLDYANSKDYQRVLNAQFVMASNDFIYKEIKISPKIHLSYQRNRHLINVTYTPEFYARRIDSGDSIGKFDNMYVSHFIDLDYTVVVKEHNKLSISANRTVSRPNYLQILWFPRIGVNNYKEIYEGNRDLVPAKFYFGKFEYTYSNKGFSVSPSISYRYGFKVIEQTFFNREAEGIVYNIYTWVNSGEDHTTSGVLRAKYEYKNLKLGFEGKINYFHSVRTNSSNVYSTDYSLSANVSYEYRGWKGMAVASYWSKVERLYVSRTEIVNLNIRIEKKLGRFTLFAIADNILDRPVYIQTIASDGISRREEQQRNYLACYKIGMNFSFRINK